MSKTKSDRTVRVIKTSKLDQRKLIGISRQYGIPPISVRELQLGFTEDIPTVAAEKLEADGFVERVTTKKRSPQERVDSLSTTIEASGPLALSKESKTESLDIDPSDTTGDPKETKEILGNGRRSI